MVYLYKKKNANVWTPVKQGVTINLIRQADPKENVQKVLTAIQQGVEVSVGELLFRIPRSELDELNLLKVKQEGDGSKEVLIKLTVDQLTRLYSSIEYDSKFKELILIMKFLEANIEDYSRELELENDV